MRVILQSLQHSVYGKENLINHKKPHVSARLKSFRLFVPKVCFVKIFSEKRYLLHWPRA